MSSSALASRRLNKCSLRDSPGRFTWRDAARIHFDLRRRGRTVRSAIDCCIAQLAIENNLRLLHRDRDFETIAEIRPLIARRVGVREDRVRFEAARSVDVGLPPAAEPKARALNFLGPLPEIRAPRD